MLAVLKFFLGQDAIDEAGSDDEEGRKNWDEEAKAKDHPPGKPFPPPRGQ
jgi:hypothetical protein